MAVRETADARASIWVLAFSLFAVTGARTIQEQVTQETDAEQQAHSQSLVVCHAPSNELDVLINQTY